MMVWSINLLVLAVGIIIVGLIKPNWILFWMEKPGRLPVVILSSILFMVAAVMFGEASKQKEGENSGLTQQVGQNKAVSDTPAVVDEIKTETINKIQKTQ